MGPITPHLWFDKEAVEAADQYVSLFPNSRITSTSVIRNTPSGDCDIVNFELGGLPFMAISAGPHFKFNPAISFIVNFDPSNDSRAVERIDEIWKALADGGNVLMPIDEYPFSPRYGWIEDKFGLSWQLMLSDPAGDPRPTIVPALMFPGDLFGKAEEAMEFYLSIFRDSKRGTMIKYGEEAGPETAGTVMFSDFEIGNRRFAMMDSAGPHDFTFNEAVSLLIPCASQDEIDYFWERLSAVPEAEQCGWLKDKYGVSWQVSPVALGEMMSTGTPDQVDRLTEAFLSMKKFEIDELAAAFGGT